METDIESIAHHHHWLIDEAHGAQSTGHCKYCHARRLFRNWLPELDFTGGDEGRSMGAGVSYARRGGTHH